MKYHPIMRTDSSTEDTSVIYTEDEFNLHEYFFLIFSAVFVIIMLCVLSTFLFNRCVMKCCIIREQRVSRSSRQVIWSPTFVAAPSDNIQTCLVSADVRWRLRLSSEETPRVHQDRHDDSLHEDQGFKPAFRRPQQRPEAIYLGPVSDHKV